MLLFTYMQESYLTPFPLSQHLLRNCVLEFPIALDAKAPSKAIQIKYLVDKETDSWRKGSRW